MSCCVQVFCPAFFVAIDHKYEAVVISIRGTLSIHVSVFVLISVVYSSPYPQDVLTDLSSEPDIVSTCGDGDVYGHRVHSILLHNPPLPPPLPLGHDGRGTRSAAKTGEG